MPPDTSCDTGSGVHLGVSLPDPKGMGPRRSSRVPGDPSPQKRRDQLRVMVAGESGLGKTTFLNNIFRHLNGGENPMEQDAVVLAQGGGLFSQSSTPTIEERTFDYQTRGGQDYRFFLVDTPGYGDHVNTNKSFKPVVDYIIAGNKRYLAEVIGGNDTPDQDDRTDVCIYFIAAHRCKLIDIEYMKQLSKAVAVIPVIGKSDSMTVDEMIDFKRVIVDKAAADASGLDFFTFSDQAWDACLAALNIEGQPDWLGERQPPPFAVISSKVDDRQEEGISPPDPARRYPWGTCHVMNKAHSDNTYLQCLLLEVGFQEMKSEMKRRYNEFRKEQARPINEKIADASKDTLHKILRARFRVLVLGVAMVCTLVAVTKFSRGRSIDPPIIPDGTCIDPSDARAGWSELIGKIQELEGWDGVVEAADSGEEQLDVLLDVLIENNKGSTSSNGHDRPSPVDEHGKLVTFGTVLCLVAAFLFAGWVSA